jgi:hypothetical protein
VQLRFHEGRLFQQNLRQSLGGGRLGGTGTVACSSASLARGTSVTEILVANVTATPGATITDKASVTSTTFDPNKANNSATAKTRVN